MYNASIHFELATFVARNTIYRYYTQQLVVVEWHCYCCWWWWCNFVFLRFGAVVCTYTMYVRICVMLCVICVSFVHFCARF